jgi:PAS domain S-box-containing protein
MAMTASKPTPHTPPPADESQPLGQLLAFFEASPDAIVTLNGDGAINGWNPKAEEMFGWSRDDAVGRQLADTIFPAGHREAQERRLARYRKTGRGDVLELIAVHYDGQEFPIEMTIWPAQVGGKKTYSAFVRNISERKESEAALTLAYEALGDRASELERSNAELEQFAYVTSHDLSEPLRMVSSFVGLLARRYEGKLDADADDFIGFAIAGTARMQTLINDLLAYSVVGRLEQSKKKVDCRKLVDEAVMSLAERIGSTSAELVIDDDLPRLLVEPTQVRRLFQNLISNSLKFSGGSAPRVLVTCRRENLAWRFSVEDNGIGIEPQHRERIFQLFERLHTRDEYEGTGLGLAICRKVVERHGGRIWVEDSALGGAAFCFTLAADDPVAR